MTRDRRVLRGPAHRGAVVIEVAMAVPALVLLLALAVLGGRTEGAQAMVDAAAANAAQAAALATDPVTAVSDAQTTVADDLQHAGPDCVDFNATADVTVDTVAFFPGGTVSVTVTCRISLSGLSPLGVSPSPLTSTAVAPIEPFRSIQPAQPGGGS